MNSSLFVTLRNITIIFATLMLVKYYVFLVLSPFHPVKEEMRKLRLARRRKRMTDEERAKSYQPRVSVVIPAWNEEVGLLRTVKSIIANTYRNVEIVVINDGSTDASHRLMEQFVAKKSWQKKRPDLLLRYVYKENGGKGTALNTGIEHSTGEIILTVDADSVLAPHAIERLVTYFEDDKIDAAVGNVKIARNRTLIGLLQQLEYQFGFYYKRAHSVMGAEYIFGGACAAFRKSKTFELIGLFDTSNRTEDIEMSLRTRYHGLHSVYAEDVISYTEGASTIRGLINQRLRWKKGRFDTFLKYRRMFFSLDKRHNRALSWFILPYAVLSELQLVFEPVGFTLLAAYSVISGDYLSFALGALFVFVIYFVAALFNHEKIKLRLVLLFPFTWVLFYVLVWVEYLALLKSFIMLVRGDEISWQRWERKGVSVK